MVLPEIMNYFNDALSTLKENKKLSILYSDSINLCIKKKISIFNIYVKMYYRDLLFNKKLSNSQTK